MSVDIEDLVSKGNKNNTEFDVVIIGAGVIGCAVARELAKYQLRIAVVEKAVDVGAGASKANSGIIHGGYDSRPGTLKAKLAPLGNRLFTQLNEELAFGLKRPGSLVLAFQEDDRAVLRELLEFGQQNQIPGLLLLERAQVLALEPAVNPEVLCALYCPSAGLVSPYEFNIALAENAIENGVVFFLETEVERIDVDPEAELRFSLHTDNSVVLAARFVVNAAGLFADKVASLVGACNFSIAPRIGEFLVLNKEEGAKVAHIIFPLPNAVKGKGILVSPTFHGNLLLGPTSRDPLKDPMSIAQTWEHIVQSARRSVPGFDSSAVITNYVGMRAKTESADFIVEESACRRFINVAASPAVALHCVGVLERAGLSLTRNHKFSPYRQPIFRAKGPDFDGTIDDPEPAKNIVCRCEKVTEAEIVSACSRGIAIKNTVMVGKRTRAGFGPCQGRFCEPRVVEVVSRVTGLLPSDIKRRSQLSTSKSLTAPEKVAISKL